MSAFQFPVSADDIPAHLLRVHLLSDGMPSFGSANTLPIELVEEYVKWRREYETKKLGETLT